MRDKDLFIPIQRTRSVEWYSNLKSGASLTRPETAQDSLTWVLWFITVEQ